MAQQFRVVPTIYFEDSCEAFCKDFEIGEKDLILTNPSYFEGYMDAFISDATVVYLKKYGKGEPTDLMVEMLWEDVKNLSFERVIAVGGGSIIDVAKILIQKTVTPVCDLFEKKIPAQKVRKLIVVPTTCGTGSEVTNVSVLDLTKRHTKLGLQTEEEFADAAVLIPELLKKLPFRFFATSSIDAFIHAVESYMSPKATPISELFSEKAIYMILNGYLKIAEMGESEKEKNIGEFLLASTYAGIAFGNAGCAAVHAMSMPFSAEYHVPHGEANYAVFFGVFHAYQRLKPEGKIKKLNAMLAEILGCDTDQVYEVLERLLNKILERKPLHAYGVREEELPGFAHVVITKQGRLTANNYTQLDEEEVLGIYRSLY